MQSSDEVVLRSPWGLGVTVRGTPVWPVRTSGHITGHTGLIAGRPLSYTCMPSPAPGITGCTGLIAGTTNIAGRSLSYTCTPSPAPGVTGCTGLITGTAGIAGRPPMHAP